MPQPKTLRLILGDQLNILHHWFHQVDDSITYVLMEIRSETDYALHHIQKLIGFFAAMRNFAQELQQHGHQVKYFHLHDADNLQSFAENCKALMTTHGFTKFEYQLPDEYRVDQALQLFVSQLEIPSSVVDSNHFYTERLELKNFFGAKQHYVMETFYRYMRKKHHVLMTPDGKPMQGKWNFDADNRKKLPKDHRPIWPKLFDHDVREIEKELLQAGVQTMGKVDSEHFIWPLNRAESLELLDFFIDHCLPLFGTFQDAMAPKEWSIYHSRLSFALNIKLISPKEVVDKVIAAYEKRSDEIAYHQVEGFVRQILGWREFMRGIYWLAMPNYAQRNYFNYTAPLPTWFWTGETHMNCLKHAIDQSLEYAYAHHIQRLMVTGNFALLAGVHPDAVDAWYLGIYMDAIEWVEITNVRGMSQFADGGMVGTKPYVSAAAYIHKMSSYCEGCKYDPSKKIGEGACPFNSLYWNFYQKHEAKLSSNPRVSMMYSIWKKMAPEAQAALLSQANDYLKNMNEL